MLNVGTEKHNIKIHSHGQQGSGLRGHSKPGAQLFTGREQWAERRGRRRKEGGREEER